MEPMILVVCESYALFQEYLKKFNMTEAEAIFCDRPEKVIDLNLPVLV